MRLLDHAVQSLQSQRGHMMTFAPVFLGVGIGVFFSLKSEPGRGVLIVSLVGAVVLFVLAHRLRHTVGPVFAAFGLIAVGMMLAGVRAHTVAGPVVDFRYYGAIEGRVVKIDRSTSDKVRLTLDRVHLVRMDPEEIPRRVRVSLHGMAEDDVPAPGATVILTGHLSAPPGPAEPGGFDFQRHAWFHKLGAVGYTRTPVLIYRPPEGAASLAVFRVRMWLSATMQVAMGGEAGAFAAAVTTGDRSGMGQATIKDLRASNLAHLLAISGLHMGLLTTFVFQALRVGFALMPWVLLRISSKKIAAIGALIVGAGYLALSGGSVATERAYIMVAVMLGAVVFDRRALTLRAVAVAALIVLFLRPEALLGAGFQMSFAATTALVAVFGWLKRFDMAWLPRSLKPAMSVFLSSLIAGAATAPIAAVHFNVVSHYGLLANLLSVPVMGAIVVPAAVFAAILSPVGLAFMPLWVMKLGLMWILGIANFVANLAGAVGRVISPGPEVLPMFALGALLIVLWRGRLRWAGLAPMMLAFVLWNLTERPAVLISHSGGLVGHMTEQGRVMSKGKGDGFAARSWLENDGDGVVQMASYERRPAVARAFEVGGLKFRHVTGKAARTVTCAGDEVLIVNQMPDAPVGCMLLGPKNLRETGSVAYHLTQDGLQMKVAHDIAGQRMWNTKAVRRQIWPRSWDK